MEWDVEEILRQLDKEMRIGQSHIWEGCSGTPKVTQTKDIGSAGKTKELTVETGAWSSVEHSGDEEGVKEKLDRLRRKTANVLVGGKEYAANVTSLSIIEEKRDGGTAHDPDYEYYVKTRMVVQVTQLASTSPALIRKVEMEKSLMELASQEQELRRQWHRVVDDERLVSMTAEERSAHLHKLDELAPRLRAIQAKLVEIRKELRIGDEWEGP